MSLMWPSETKELATPGLERDSERGDKNRKEHIERGLCVNICGRGAKEEKNCDKRNVRSSRLRIKIPLTCKPSFRGHS